MWNVIQFQTTSCWLSAGSRHDRQRGRSRPDLAVFLAIRSDSGSDRKNAGRRPPSRATCGCPSPQATCRPSPQAACGRPSPQATCRSSPPSPSPSLLVEPRTPHLPLALTKSLPSWLPLREFSRRQGRLNFFLVLRRHFKHQTCQPLATPGKFQVGQQWTTA